MPRRSLLLALLMAASLAADPRSELFSLLDSAEHGNREEVLAALQKLAIAPEQGLQFLRAGRVYGDAETGHFLRSFTSAEGVETEVEFWVPESYDPAQPTAAMVFLHGLGASPRMFYELVGPACEARGWILIMPRAERLKDVTSLPMLLRGANLMQHWWSYHDDNNYGLLALDWARSAYNIDSDRCYLGGYSMGGYATWNVGSRYHDRFAAIVPYAAGDLSGTPGVHDRDDAYRLLENLASTPAWITHSRDDNMVSFRIAERIMAHLDELGIPYQSDIVDGEGHRLRVAGIDNPRNIEMFAWLEQQVRATAPESFSHVALDAHNAWAYNLQLLSWQGALGEVALQRREGRVELNAPEGTALQVYLELEETPELLWNGVRQQLQAETSWEVLLDSWLAHRDPALTWCRRVALPNQDSSGQEDF